MILSFYGLITSVKREAEDDVDTKVNLKKQKKDDCCRHWIQLIGGEASSLGIRGEASRGGSGGEASLGVSFFH